MELWYRKIGFFSNPFSIKPGAFHDAVVGYNLQEFLDKIEDGKVQYVKADYGTGKTTILKHIIRRFGGGKKVAFATCNIAEGTLDTKKLLTGRTLLNRTFGILPADMILLVDEAQDIAFAEAEEILYFYRNGNIKAVVFFGTDLRQKNLPKGLNSLLKDNIISLARLTPNHAVEIVRKRIGGIKLLPDSIIKRLYDISGNNPRRLLENCEDLCRFVVSKNALVANETHVKALFGSSRPQKKHIQKAKRKSEPNIKIEEITDKSKVNLKFDYSKTRSFEEEMAFGR